jgi:hypothetical protein
MALYDDDGEDGLPGTQLAIVDVTPYAFGWAYCDFSPADVTINSGDFYGVMIQGGDYPDCAPIAIDETNPVFRSYSQYISGNEPWRPASFADFMMRAYVYSGAVLLKWVAQVSQWDRLMLKPDSTTLVLASSFRWVNPGITDPGPLIITGSLSCQGDRKAIRMHGL